MKVVVLTLGIISSLFSLLHAQPILTYRSIGPQDGDVFYGHRVDNITSPGLSGANVAWNFALLKELGPDSASYFSCDATPSCIMYQNSIEKAGSVSNSALKKMTMIPGHMFSGIGQDAMHYPMSYSYTYSDTLHTEPANTVVHTETDSFIYDGYGTLYLPDGRDTGVVRIHTISYIKDSSLAGVTRRRTEYYTWYQPGFHNPLLVIRYDTAGAPKGQHRVSYASYYSKKAVSSPPDATLLAESLIVSPNPSMDKLQISFNSQHVLVSAVYITDLSGRVVATIRNDNYTEGLKTITYPIDNILPGMYFIHLASSVGRISKQVIINRQN